MFRKEFDLIQYHNNYFSSKKINNFDKNFVSTVQAEINEITKICNAYLVHECKNFEDFSGRDIDTFFVSKNKFLSYEKENVILYETGKGSYRFLINNENSSKFLNLDVEDLSIFSPKTKFLNKDFIQSAIKCEKTGLIHLNLKAITYFKIVKYFSKGVIHSYEQLYELKKNLKLLNPIDLDFILDLISKNLPSENIWIKKLIENDFKSYEQNKDVKNFWIKKRIIRQKKRRVFSGKLRLINLFRSKKFIYAFLFGSYAKWPKLHRPMPAIAIIGNDGAGKTEMCNYVLNNFSKMDPAFFNMRSDVTIMPFTNFLKRHIRKCSKLLILNKIPILKNFILLIGQLIDLLDKYIRYKIGIAFADSGFGVTIFERYVTDKIRGEFPNDKNSFLPLEQFFPFPDGFVYLDVKPEISLERKINDNHNIYEMTCKRENYLSLIKEFDEVKKIPCTNSFDQSIKDLKNYIFKLTNKKQNNIKSGYVIKRCKWSKNKKRILMGNPTKRFQKDSFL